MCGATSTSKLDETIGIQSWIEGWSNLELVVSNLLKYSKWCENQCASARFSPGNLKLALPGETFLECAKTDPPANTLFPNVSPIRVGKETMEFYLPLILRMFEASPEGFLSSNWTHLS